MKVAKVKLESTCSYRQSRFYETEKKSQEQPNEFEKRTWRDKCHTNGDGNIIIPAIQFKNCVMEAAKYANIKIPGQAKATYTKHFRSGFMITSDIKLPIKKEDVEGIWQMHPANPGSMSNTRVTKCHPIIPEWKGTVTFHILDDIITEEVFAKVLKTAGNFIGIGMFRPANGGMHGRFRVTDIDWQEVPEASFN